MVHFLIIFLVHFLITIYTLMEPMPGAIEAVNSLAEKYDCYILTTAPWKNPSAWGDKIAWVTKYLDNTFHKKVIMTHHKELLDDGSAILIDDRKAHGADSFGDRLLMFGTDTFPDWESVLLKVVGEPISRTPSSVS